MAKGIKEYYLFLMALVVIVAAVSIVLQISNKTSCQVGVEEETLLADDSGEIVGMAYNVGTCTDQDSVPIIDKTQYKIKSSAFLNTKSPKSINDVCSRTSTLLEATCDSSGKLVTHSVDCAEEFGAEYTCIDGACKSSSSPASQCIPGYTGQNKCETVNKGGVLASGVTYNEYYKEYTNTDCTKTWHTIPCAPGVNCDPDKGCCVSYTSLMCKDNKVYSVTLNTCNPQSTDVLKDDCVAKGGVCKDDACVCQASTISKKCVKQASAYLFEKTEKTANCSLKVSSVSCGSKDTSCDNTKGCCKDVSVSAVCEGDRIHNVIQNSCTGKKTESYYDCYPEIDTYTGKHKTCLMAKFNSPGAGVMDQSVTPSNSASCVASSCTFVGSNIYSCLDNGKYAEFTCKASGIPGYNYWGFSGAYYDTCPDLKFDLCYDPKAMCK